IYTSLEDDQIYWNPWDRWYAPGLLRYVLYPWKDGPTNVDDATLENTVFRKYEYVSPVPIPSVNIQVADYNSSEGTYKRLHAEIFYVREEWAGEWNCREIQSGTAKDEFGWRGDVKLSYKEDAPKGLADHSFSIESFDGEGHTRLFYYDHGTFNATSNIFIVNPTNHLYTTDLSLTNYPDRRVTTLHIPRF